MIDMPRDDYVMMMEAAYIYVAMGKYTEAKQVFEGLIALSPKQEVPLVGLANVLFAQKKFLPAIRVLKDALEINPKSAFALAHLGEALLFYGKKNEALEALAKAGKLEPKGKAGDFARALADLMAQGYDPEKFRKDQKAGKGARSK